MKIFKYRWFSVLLVLAVSLTACSHFEEMNYDPNSPTKVPTAGLLTQAQANLVYNLNGELAQLGLQYVQQFTQLDYVEKSNYGDDGISSFAGIYLGGLNDLQEVIRLNTDEKTKLEVLQYGDNENQIAVASILQAWAFHNITDVWGDIPYSEALQGGSDVIAPKYDTQESIYDGLITQLNTAIAQINTTPKAQLQGDLIFGGDMAMWKKFAVSLKLRIAMRLSEANSTKAGSLINDADFANAFSSSADYARFDHLSTEAEANPIYIDNVINGGGDYFATADTFIDALKNLNDPRIAAYANVANSTGTYVGLTYGITGSDTDVSLPGDMYAAQTAPSILMLASEVLFIKAEAAQRGYIAGDAAQFYNDAIRASMEYNGVASADIDTYLAQTAVQYNTANWRELIGTQKWFALYAQGIQAWAEHRRLNYPVLTPGADATISQIPTRRAYSSGEYSTNKENVTAAVANLGGSDLFTGKVWWDK